MIDNTLIADAKNMVRTHAPKTLCSKNVLINIINMQIQITVTRMMVKGHSDEEIFEAIKPLLDRLVTLSKETKEES